MRRYKWVQLSFLHSRVKHFCVVVSVALGALLPSFGYAETIRVATYNIQDVRTHDLLLDHQPRLEKIAAIVTSLEADVILLNEIAYDKPEYPYVPKSQKVSGLNADRFVAKYLSQNPTTPAFKTISLESNTGIPSGYDLDNSGIAVATLPVPINDSTLKYTSEQRAYGNDSHGFGIFPGQYSMALLVAPDFEILKENIRTYRLFKWSNLPNVRPPIKPDGSPWYSAQAWAHIRLPSKTLADIPVRTPSGTIIHFIVSHPTPPGFDGAEQRNRIRNRDEIRLLRAFMDNETWLVDDRGKKGGLKSGAHAVILGDLNADPANGPSLKNAITHLLASPTLAPDIPPISDVTINGLDPWDTSGFGLRVDYVLPTKRLAIAKSAIWRPTQGDKIQSPSDHFPVWADIVIKKSDDF